MARHEGCRASYARSWPGAHLTARAIGATTSPVCPPRAGHGRQRKQGAARGDDGDDTIARASSRARPPCFLCTVAALEIRRRARRGRRDGVASACRAAPRRGPRYRCPGRLLASTGVGQPTDRFHREETTLGIVKIARVQNTQSKYGLTTVMRRFCFFFCS
jgi:hypothetical protein